MRFIIGLIVSLMASAFAETSKSLLMFQNDSDDFLSIYWIDTRKQEPHLIKNDVRPRSTFSLNSYVGHRFEIRQMLDPNTGLCGGKDKACDLSSQFEVTTAKEQEFVITEGVKIGAPKEPKQSPRIRNVIERINLDVVNDPMVTLAACKELATKRLNELDERQRGDESLTKKIHEDLHDCLTIGLAPRVKASNDEVEFERTLRLEASNIAENFTCVNTDLESSPDVITEDWASPKDSVTRTVHKKLEREASKIHVVEGFASPAECKAMEEAAEKDLHVASTADGKGGTRVSNSRKAMQAGINPKFEEDGTPLDGNLISVLSARVYEYTNHVLDLNITHHGQEPLMSIQYFGRGRHDIEPDRYTPHCDGRCTGEPVLDGGRVATMVIYCTLPEEGGFTNFQNANVHVKPRSGDAVFFSYFDPLTNVTDNGLTQHSGCPVYEGEKKIITQWVRYGVSSRKPHSAFNTLGILRAEDGE